MSVSYGRLGKPADPARKMDSLCSYLPTSILTHLAAASSTPSSLAPPFRQTYTTAVLFADVSGYTAMCEQMSMRGNRIAPIGGGDTTANANGSGSGTGGSTGKVGNGASKGKSDLPHSHSFSLLPHYSHSLLPSLSHTAANHSHEPASTPPLPTTTASQLTHPHPHPHPQHPHVLHASSESLIPPTPLTHLSRSPSLPSVTSYPSSVSFGPGGDELLAKHLNSYFEQLVRTISSHGGDVFKFAGDAILVLWPKGGGGEGEGAEGLEEKVRRAAQCGMEIKTRLQDMAMGDGITLSMKVGVGVGDISILHVGGVFDRMEYIATGSPLLQAFAAEHQASQRDVVISPQAWSMIAPYFSATVQSSGYAVLEGCVEPLRKVSVARHGAGAVQWRDLLGGVKESELMRTLGRYVPGAVLPYINHQEEKWASELRRITVLFVNLGLLSGDTPATADTTAELLFVQSILHATQLAVYKYEGSLNKFLRDDKGSTLIAVFGLPPLAHEDDAVRGILAALAICARLIDLGLKPSVGVTTGMAFCGIVGTRGRREYSVLGDKVNLAARLMQHASMGYGGVLCDHETRYAAKDRLSFEEGGKIVVKGKSKPVSVYQPYPRTIASLFSLQGKRMKVNRAGSVVAEGGGGSVPLTTQQAAKTATGSSSNGLIGQIPVLTRTTSTVMYRTGGDGGGEGKSDSGLTARGSNHHAFFEGRSGVGMSSIRSIFDIFKQDHPKKATASTPSASRQQSDPTQPHIELSDRDRQRHEAQKREMRRRLTAALDDPVKPNIPLPLMNDLQLFRDNHTYAASYFEQCQQRRRERERGRGSGAAISAPVPIPGQGARESRLIGVNEAGEGEREEGEEHSVSEVGERKSVNGLSSASPSSSSPSPHPTHPPPHPRTTPSHASLRSQPYSLQIHPSHTPPLFSSTDSTPDTGSTPSTAEGVVASLADTKAREQAAAARRHSTPDLSTQLKPMRRPASSSNLLQLERVNERRAMTPSKQSAPPGSTPASTAGKGASGSGGGTSSAAGGLGLPSVLRSHSFPDQDDLQLLSAAPMAGGDSRRSSISHSISMSNADDKQLASPLLTSASTSAHQPPPPLSSVLPLPHRSITIILPDHVSSLTMSIVHLPTIRQVKEEVLLSLYRRGVLSIPAEMSVKAMMDEWMLCVERDGEEMRVADDMRVDSLTLQDRRLSSSISSTSAPSVSTGTSTLTLYLHHYPPSVTPPNQLAHYTEFLTHRIQLLLSSHHSSTIIIEGDVGLGKSKLLSTALTSAPATVAHTIQALANPFDSQRPLSVFRDVFATLCDEEVMRVGVSEYCELSQAENRRKVILQKLRRRRREDDGRGSLESVVGCLNEVVTGLDMEETEETEAMSREERIQWSMLLLINVIHMIACSHPLVIVIDEAVFLDHYSWQLVLSLSRLDAGLLLLLATRPINKSNMAAFQTQTPLEYTTLLQEQQTSVITLQPRSDEVMYEMLREALGEKVEQVPAGLAQFVIRKAHGNPLVVKELVYALTHEKLVEVDANGHITLSPSLPLTSSNPHLLSSLVLPIPIPLTLSSILGSRLDRLGYVQRMLLKCAAVIGEEVGERLLVRLWELREMEKSGLIHGHGAAAATGGSTGSTGSTSSDGDGGHPHREEVVRELSGLLEMNMLRKGYGYEERERWEQQGTIQRNQERDDGGSERERVKYTFTHGFMREMVLSRMLDSQKQELEAKLSAARCEMLRRKTEFLYTPQSAPTLGTSSMAMAIPPTVSHYSTVQQQQQSHSSATLSHSYTYHPSTPHGGRDPFAISYGSWQTTSQPSTPSSVSYALAPSFFQPNTAPRPLLTGTFTLIDSRPTTVSAASAISSRFFALYPELLACWDNEAAYTESHGHNPRLCLHLDDSLLADDEQRVNAVVLLSLCWVERGGEAVSGVREVGLMWREDEMYERWAMAIYRQLATESPMPQRLYTKQVEREMEEEEKERDSTTADSMVDSVMPLSTPTLTTSSSFSSLLSLLHTPSSKPTHSTSTTASAVSSVTPSSAASQSTLTLTPAERELYERKLTAVHTATASSLHYILPPALMLVRKHKRGLFSSTWKKRYVFLTEDVLGIQETRQGRPSQLLLVSVGRVVGKAGGYDAQKRLHLLSVEVDCWLKGTVITWSRRSVLFAAGSSDEVKVWVDSITQLLQKRRRNSVSLPWQNSSSRPAHSSSISASASSILAAPGPHQRSASTNPWSGSQPVNRPLFMTLASDRRAGVGGAGSGSSSPVVGPYSGSPSSSFISPALLQHVSYSSSPPSHNSRVSISTGGLTSPGPSPPLLFNERRRNSLNRLAPLAGVGTETVMEGREEPESGKVKEDGRDEEGKINVSGRGLKVDVDDCEERIDTVVLERKEADGGSRVVAVEEVKDAADREELDDEQMEADYDDNGGDLETSLNGYHDSQSLQQHLSNVHSAFADANAQLVALSSPSPSSAEAETALDRQRREALSASMQSLLVRLQQQMAETVKAISRDCAAAMDQHRAAAADDDRDPVFRTWRNSMPVVPPASLSSSLFPPPISSLSTLGDFFDWNYDIFALPASSLLPLVYSLFSHFSFFSLFSIPLTVFSRFVSSIQQQYRLNPFHSFYHAVDVTQTTFVLLTSFHAQRSLTPVECFSLLLAALCHDVDHPALNNHYHTNAQTQLALVYNDSSVLENHHCSVTFHTLAQHTCNVFASFHHSDYVRARKVITQGILSTDMALHFDVYEKLREFVDGREREGRGGVLEVGHINEAQRLMLFCVYLHAADISNPCKRWELHKRWTDGLQQEQLAQGAKEAREGIDRSPYTDPNELYGRVGELTCRFIHKFVTPLFALLQRLMPEMEVCLAQIDDNMQRWLVEDERFRRGALTVAAGGAVAADAGGAGGGLKVVPVASERARDDGVTAMGAGGRLRWDGAGGVGGGGGLIQTANGGGAGGPIYRRRNSAV